MRLAVSVAIAHLVLLRLSLCSDNKPPGETGEAFEGSPVIRRRDAIGDPSKHDYRRDTTDSQPAPISDDGERLARAAAGTTTTLKGSPSV